LWEVLGQWDPVDKDAEYVGWVDGAMDALTPHSLTNGYVNLSTDRGAEWLRGLYGSPEKWDRICALKAEFDPDNRLSHNKNVTRARAAVAV
jgi:FAD/FMN-containing dehydrogenase